MKEPDQEKQSQSRQVLKMLQQKIGNVELTVHAMMNVLEQEGLMDQERINEEAQKIVGEMQDISEEEIQKEIEERINDKDL